MEVLVDLCHVPDPPEVQLMRHGDRAGGSVAVLAEDQIDLARPGARGLVGVLTVQEDDRARVLL